MFDIDLQSRTPIYEQLYKRVVSMTVKQELHGGDKLPSVRELAKELGVNPNTVSKAFQMLERDGMINSVPGKGSFISGDNAAAIRRNAMVDFECAVDVAIASGLSGEDMISSVNSAVSRHTAVSPGEMSPNETADTENDKEERGR